jgi:hypothetical protein
VLYLGEKKPDAVRDDNISKIPDGEQWIKRLYVRKRLEISQKLAKIKLYEDVCRRPMSYN